MHGYAGIDIRMCFRSQNYFAVYFGLKYYLNLQQPTGSVDSELFADVLDLIAPFTDEQMTNIIQLLSDANQISADKIK